MPQVPSVDVFTVTEVARAAGVPLDAVRTVMARGELRFIRGTRFITLKDAARAARHLRNASIAFGAQPRLELFASDDGTLREARRPAVASLLVHVTLVLLAVWLSSSSMETAPLNQTAREETHLVFLMSPGPGGGGGGGGQRQPRPAPKIARRGQPRLQVSVPAVSEKPVVTSQQEAPKPTPAEPIIQPKPEPAPEPVPAKVIVAPVETVAANDRDRDGAIEHATDGPDSRGPGTDGGVGRGQGTGNGEGLGAGIGEGENGGTGGGPYRPGSGIAPPRLLKEVKAEYTEEARRRNLTGEVLLEIVVRQDGSVGTVRIVNGLGSGLDQRAVDAVRQWRFFPAQRKGAPVDVLVTVSVEFKLR